MALLSRGVRKLTILLVALGMIAGVQPLPANAAVPVCGGSISGSALIGSTLTAPGCTNAPTSFVYQWSESSSSNGTYVAIQGATANTYVVQPQVAGRFIKVTVSATNADGTSAAYTTATPSGPMLFAATTFAGSNTVGAVDGVGSAAGFNQIRGITSDSNGNLYVCDYGALTIRRISANGAVTTIAGSGVSGFVDGVGLSAQFKGPTSIAYSPASNSLLIKDLSIIRELDLATMQVSTLTHTAVVTSASKSGSTVTLNFASAHGFSNQSITVSGLGAGFDGTFALISVSTPTRLTYSAGTSQTVASFVPNNATVSGVMGPVNGSANNWWTVYESFRVGPDGNLYMFRTNAGESANQGFLLKLSRVSGSEFLYETLTSLSYGSADFDFGMTANVIYADTGTNVVKLETTDGWVTRTSTTLALPTYNSGLVFDPAGYLFQGQARYNISTNTSTTVLANPSISASMWELTANDLYLAADRGSKIIKYASAGSGQNWLNVVNNYNPNAQQSFSVTFNANGGSGSMATQSASTQSALTANAFTHSTDTFAGWNTAANGSGTPYADQANYAFLANLVLYAQWTSGAQLQNTPVIANDSAIVTSWTQPRVTLGGTARVVLKGYQLQHVSSVQSSSGKARILKQGDDILEVEISEALLGLGSIKLNSPSRVLTIQDAFNVVSIETNASGIPPAKQLTISFAPNASSLSAEAKRQLISQLKNLSTPRSFVITGSVATDRYSLTSRSLAMNRAKAVAAVIAQVFANIKPKLLVTEPRGQSASNDSVTVAVSLLR